MLSSRGAVEVVAWRQMRELPGHDCPRTAKFGDGRTTLRSHSKACIAGEGGRRRVHRVRLNEIRLPDEEDLRSAKPACEAAGDEYCHDELAGRNSRPLEEWRVQRPDARKPHTYNNVE